MTQYLLHVKLWENAWRIISKNRYRWIYNLKEPVVPGDILQVKSKKGPSFITVDDIEYVTGSRFCGKHRKARRHMKVRMKSN